MDKLPTLTTFLQLVSRNTPNVTHTILNGFFLGLPRTGKEDFKASASLPAKQYKKSITTSECFQVFLIWDSKTMFNAGTAGA